MVSTGERIRRVREMRSLSQKELCEQIPCSKAALSQWENGVYEPSLATLRKIAKICGAELTLLVGDEDPRPRG